MTSPPVTGGPRRRALQLLFSIWSLGAFAAFARGRLWANESEPGSAIYLVFAVVALVRVYQLWRAGPDLPADVPDVTLAWPVRPAGARRTLRVVLLRGALVTAAIVFVMGPIVHADNGYVLSVVAFAFALGATVTAAAGIELSAEGGSPAQHSAAAASIAFVAAAGVVVGWYQGGYARALVRSAWNHAWAAEVMFDEMRNDVALPIALGLGVGLTHGVIAWAHLRVKRKPVVIGGLALAWFVSLVVCGALLYSGVVDGRAALLMMPALGGFGTILLVPSSTWLAAQVEAWLTPKLDDLAAP